MQNIVIISCHFHAIFRLDTPWVFTHSSVSGARRRKKIQPVPGWKFQNHRRKDLGHVFHVGISCDTIGKINLGRYREELKILKNHILDIFVFTKNLGFFFCMVQLRKLNLHNFFLEQDMERSTATRGRWGSGQICHGKITSILLVWVNVEEDVLTDRVFFS